MVSFQCDGCADTVKKPQLDKHRNRCWAPFTCLDCSTTFQNQDYKSHTSCISEAEKYQGALYKGPKKSAQSTPAASTPAVSTPADSPAPEAGGIHPSRQGMVSTGEDSTSNSGYGGYGGRGRGGFQRGSGRGRGGFGRGGFQQGERTPKYSLTGENRATPEGGMRAWGSAPTSDAEAAPREEPKPRKKKGDKGGTGSKANSSGRQAASRLREETSAAAEEPQPKKRKREGSAPAAPAPSGPPSDKTLKKIRKHMSKLEDKTKTELPLAQWLQQVGQGKEKSVDQSEVLQGLKVAFVDGHWQLSV